jgi:lauroyl/myristoyl acyltransferase
MANLALALPDTSPAEHQRLLRASLQSFALAILDTIWLARDTPQRIEKLMTFDPTFRESILKPGAQICITAHLGNWEFLGLAVSQEGFPLTSVAAPLKNPWVDPLFNGLRHMAGQRAIPKQGAVRHLLKTLRNGGKIALVLDQNVKPAQGGIFVEFFGLKAPFSSAAAQLSLRTGAPIVIGACVPDAVGNYRTPPVKIIDLQNLPTDETAAVLELTQRIAHGLEALVREHPDCWMWAYKRWKMRPDDEDPARYPYYTRALRHSDLPSGRSESTGTPVSQTQR